MKVHLIASDLQPLCKATPRVHANQTTPELNEVTCPSCRVLHDLAVELDARTVKNWVGTVTGDVVQYEPVKLWSRASLQAKAEFHNRSEYFTLTEAAQ